MGFFDLEHSRLAYLADFTLYGSAVVVLAAFLLIAGPGEQRPEIVTLALVGLGSWSALEYVLHRFVLHGLQPFRRWRIEHHSQPTALICAPTILSATLIVVLVFLPSLLLGDLWSACALTFGLLSGYLGYAITHHAVHHWRADSVWLKKRKRWHALHHHSEQPGCFGVTSAFRDYIFGSAHQTAPVDYAKQKTSDPRRDRDKTNAEPRSPDRKMLGADFRLSNGMNSCRFQQITLPAGAETLCCNEAVHFVHHVRGGQQTRRDHHFKEGGSRCRSA